MKELKKIYVLDNTSVFFNIALLYYRIFLMQYVFLLLWYPIFMKKKDYKIKMYEFCYLLLYKSKRQMSQSMKPHHQKLLMYLILSDSEILIYHKMCFIALHYLIHDHYHQFRPLETHILHQLMQVKLCQTYF